MKNDQIIKILQSLVYMSTMYNIPKVLRDEYIG